MFRIPFTITHENKIFKSVYIYSIKMFRDLTASKKVFCSNTQITSDVTLTSSSRNHHNHFLFNHNTAGLVTFSNI